jgi:hypothetical protein
MNLKISSSSRTESFDNLTKVWPWSFAFVQLLKNNEKYIPPPIWLLCEKEPPSVMGNLGPIRIQVVLQTIYIGGHLHSSAGYERQVPVHFLYVQTKDSSNGESIGLPIELSSSSFLV